MALGNPKKPVQWQEGEYTVTRTSSWSPPGDHPLGAGMLLYVKDGILVKVEGDPDHPLTHGALPMRLVSLPEYVYSPDRVLYPMKRDPQNRGVADKWERISWDEAYDLFCEKATEVTEKYGAEYIEVWTGTGRQCVNWSTIFAMGALNSSGTCYTQSGWSCYGPRCFTTLNTLGLPYPEVDNAVQFEDGMDNPAYTVPECIMIWGKEPLKSNPDGFWGHSLIELMKRGTELIVVDPRLTFLASKAKYHLQLRPGTDCALAMAMLDTIMKEDLYDKEFVENWCWGFEALAERVSEMPAEKAAEICGIPEKTIVEAARFYAAAKPSSLQWGLAVDQNVNGIQVGLALTALMAICGQIDQPGGIATNVLPISGPGEAIKDVEPHSKFDILLGDDIYPAITRTVRQDSADIMLENLVTDDPKPKMSVFFGSNVLACPGAVPKTWLEGVNNIPFNVVIDIVMTPTAQGCCDLFLPTATFAEFDGFVAINYGNCGQFLASINKAIEPVGDTKSDLTIMREIGARMRPQLWPYKTDAEFLDARTLDKLPFTFADLQEHGWFFLDWEYEKYKTGKMRPDGNPGFNTPSGRVELYSTGTEVWGEDPLPYYIEPPMGPIAAPELAKEYPLVLTTGQRTWSYFHSEGRHIPTWREIEPNPLVEVNPADAERYGVREGDWVYLENHIGKCKMMVSIQPGMKEGVVAAQHGWWFPERSGDDLYDVFESNVNMLVPNNFVGKLGYGAPYKSLICKMYKCE